MRLDIARVGLGIAALHPSHGQFLTIGLLAALSALAIYGGYAYLFSASMAVRACRRFFRAIEAAFGAIGGRLLVDGLRKLRR